MDGLMRHVILGHRGMVGSALHRLMPDAHTTDEVYDKPPDLRFAGDTGIVLHKLKPDVLYLCAARAGGIGRNMAEPGRMLYDNLMIQTNVIEAARTSGVKLVVFPA